MIYQIASSKFKSILLLLILTIFSLQISAQTEASWTNYVKTKEKGPMTILVDLNLKFRKPALKNLVMVGLKTNKCQKNGYPKEEGLEELYEFSDAMATIIEENSKSHLVGVLTYQCTGFDIYYVKDTIGLRDKIDTELNLYYHKRKVYTIIERDKLWNYYKKEVYPIDKPEDFFINHDLLTQMVTEGDDLKGKRNIKHYTNFKREKHRDKYIKIAKELKYKIDTLTFNKEDAFPFKIVTSRLDNINPESIEILSNSLIQVAAVLVGFYEGWETEVKQVDK